MHHHFRLIHGHWPYELNWEMWHDWLIPSLKGSFHSETCSLLPRRIERGWTVWFNRQLCSWKTRQNNFKVLQIYSFINLSSYLFIIQLFIYLFFIVPFIIYCIIFCYSVPTMPAECRWSGYTKLGTLSLTKMDEFLEAF